MSLPDRKGQAAALLDRLQELLHREAALLNGEEPESAGALAQEIEVLLQKLQEPLEAEPSLKDGEIGSRLRELHRRRKENLLLARQRREELLQQLQGLRQGKKALQAYQPPELSSRGEKFVYKSC